MRKIALAASVAIALAGCATPSLEQYAKAANDLDPGCGKRVHLSVTPVIVGAWVVPVIGGTYDKSCNPDQFNPSPPTPTNAGPFVPQPGLPQF
jgi:hypothetical protein